MGPSNAERAAAWLGWHPEVDEPVWFWTSGKWRPGWILWDGSATGGLGLRWEDGTTMAYDQVTPFAIGHTLLPRDGEVVW